MGVQIRTVAQVVSVGNNSACVHLANRSAMLDELDQVAHIARFMCSTAEQEIKCYDRLLCSEQFCKIALLALLCCRQNRQHSGTRFCRAVLITSIRLRLTQIHRALQRNCVQGVTLLLVSKALLRHTQRNNRLRLTTFLQAHNSVDYSLYHG